MTNYTPEQNAVIAFVRDNPTLHLMVSARAGSGKTFTIEKAAAEINPVFGAIAVAFNKKIKEELEKRLPSHIDTATMNSIGHRAWAKVVRGRITLDPDKTFRLTKGIVETNAEAIGPDPDGEMFNGILGLTRGAKSAGLVPKGASMGKKGLIPDDDESWDELAFSRSIDHSDLMVALAKKVLHASIKEAYAGTIDFDDQIYMSVLFGGVFTKYHTVIVDEAQDLSPMNHIMLQKMTDKRLIAIGDPYQAIYGFRGADSNSMTTLRDMFNIPEEQVLTLTYSFRCPQVVAKRQHMHVPDFRAHETCQRGEVLRWPEEGHTEGWTLDMIPQVGAILCRNNYPLMKLAFALIKDKRPVKILGRDIGASLASLLGKIVSKRGDTTVEVAAIMVEDWRTKELEKNAGKESRKDAIHDKADSLLVLLESSDATTVAEAQVFITTLFTDNGGPGLNLASGHKSKGLEWDWVLHLDPWRVPSKQAKRAMDNGNPAPMQQELNLRYVIETRTKGTLVLASLDDCTNIGKELG